MLNKKQRKVARDLLGSIAQFRLKMNDCRETAVKLSITFEDLERQAQHLYNDLRLMVTESAVDLVVPRKRGRPKRRPAPIAAGTRP